MEMTVPASGKAWHTGRLTLTEAGRRLLSGELDFLACAPPERWVGGVTITGGQPAWRWDPGTERPRRD